MGRKPRVITECPNKENTISLEVFQKQYPARFSSLDDDKYVLHGGGHGLRVTFVQAPQNVELALDPQIRVLQHHLVLAYALNTSFILWVPDVNIGVELPYQYIALLALKEVSGKTALYLQVLSNDIMATRMHEESEYISTVEMLIEQPDMTIMGFKGNEADLYLRSLLNLSNRGIEPMYQALSRCSAFHYDSGSEAESIPEMGASSEEGNTQWFTAADCSQGNAPTLEVPLLWINAGDADDLGLGEEGTEEAKEEDEEEAGMHVNLGNGQLAGSVRRLESSNSDIAKARRIE